MKIPGARFRLILESVPAPLTREEVYRAVRKVDPLLRAAEATFLWLSLPVEDWQALAEDVQRPRRPGEPLLWSYRFVPPDRAALDFDLPAEHYFSKITVVRDGGPAPEWAFHAR